MKQNKLPLIAAQFWTALGGGGGGGGGGAPPPPPLLPPRSLVTG